MFLFVYLSCHISNNANVACKLFSRIIHASILEQKIYRYDMPCLPFTIHEVMNEGKQPDLIESNVIKSKKMCGPMLCLTGEPLGAASTIAVNSEHSNHASCRLHHCVFPSDSVAQALAPFKRTAASKFRSGGLTILRSTAVGPCFPLLQGSSRFIHILHITLCIEADTAKYSDQSGHDARH